MGPLEFVLFFILGGILCYIIVFNILVAAKQKVNEAWADVDVQLKRRHDLIPNLVHTVKGYASHEKDLLEKVTKERTKAIETDKKNMKEVSAIESQLGLDVNELLLIAEAYPDLKANHNFLKLQEDLTETEDQIASSRRIYNANVTNYNTKLQIFPLNVVASLHHLEPGSFFSFKEAKEVPSAKF